MEFTDSKVMALEGRIIRPLDVLNPDSEVCKLGNYDVTVSPPLCSRTSGITTCLLHLIFPNPVLRSRVHAQYLTCIIPDGLCTVSMSKYVRTVCLTSASCFLTAVERKRHVIFLSRSSSTYHSHAQISTLACQNTTIRS